MMVSETADSTIATSLPMSDKASHATEAASEEVVNTAQLKNGLNAIESNGKQAVKEEAEEDLQGQEADIEVEDDHEDTEYHDNDSFTNPNITINKESPLSDISDITNSPIFTLENDEANIKEEDTPEIGEGDEEDQHGHEESRVPLSHSKDSKPLSSRSKENKANRDSYESSELSELGEDDSEAETDQMDFLDDNTSGSEIINNNNNNVNDGGKDDVVNGKANGDRIKFTSDLETLSRYTKAFNEMAYDDELDNDINGTSEIIKDENDVPESEDFDSRKRPLEEGEDGRSKRKRRRDAASTSDDLENDEKDADDEGEEDEQEEEKEAEKDVAELPKEGKEVEDNENEEEGEEEQEEEDSIKQESTKQIEKDEVELEEAAEVGDRTSGDNDTTKHGVMKDIGEKEDEENENVRDEEEDNNKDEEGEEDKDEADEPKDNNDDEEKDEEDEDVENEEEEELDDAHLNEQRKLAIEELISIEAAFAELRDKLYQDKLNVLERELQLCLEGSHPELSKIYYKVNGFYQDSLKLANSNLAYKLKCTDKETIATRTSIHQDYLKNLMDTKNNMISETTSLWYKINKERQQIDQSVPDFNYSAIPSIPGVNANGTIDEAYVNGTVGTSSNPSAAQVPNSSSLDYNNVNGSSESQPLSKKAIKHHTLIELIDHRNSINSQLGILNGLVEFHGFPAAINSSISNTIELSGTTEELLLRKATPEEINDDLRAMGIPI